MDQVHVIRHKVLAEGQSARRVAREMGLSRNTVAKYLTQSAPVRRAAPPRPSPMRERITTRVGELIDEWSARTTRKQRITGTRLHRQLSEEGFVVGKTTVYEVWRERRRQAAEVFIPLVHLAGDSAQVDFFEVTVDVAGLRQHAWKFVMRLMHSGYDFVWLYERGDQLSFLDAHVRAFTYFQGVPARCVYDNLAAAVTRKLGLYGIERTLTPRFAALASHYLFEPCFARPGEGHDKGGVEARGKGIRLQHLTPIPYGQTRQEIAAVLLQQVTRAAARTQNAAGETIAARFAVEQPTLRALPSTAFDVRQRRLLTASRQATVTVDGALYSVPSRWAGLSVTAFVGVEEICFVCRDEERTHQRRPRGTRSIRYRDYLPELARKPQAVRQVAVQLVEELGAPYPALWALLVATHGGLEAGRTLARLLAAMSTHGEEAVRATLDDLLAATTSSASAAPRLPSAPAMPVSEPSEVAVPESLRGYQVEAGRASDYDWLLAIAGAEAHPPHVIVSGGVQ